MEIARSAHRPARDPLLEMLAWPKGVLSLNADWRTSRQVLRQLAERIVRRPPALVLECGTGIGTLVIARMLQRQGQGQGPGRLISIDCDPAAIEDARAAATGLGLEEQITWVEAPLEAYRNVGYWYDLWHIARLPRGADLLFIAGPPHYAGKNPVYPASKELFPLLADDADVLLDKSTRAKEGRALKRWAREAPEWVQSPAEQSGATWLRRQA